MNRKAVTSIRASTLRFQSLKSNFSHGAWTGRDIWPAFSVLHLLDSAEQAAGSRDTFSFDHCSGALAKCGFRWLFVACCAWNPIYRTPGKFNVSPKKKNIFFLSYVYETPKMILLFYVKWTAYVIKTCSVDNPWCSNPSKKESRMGSTGLLQKNENSMFVCHHCCWDETWSPQ